MRPSEFVRSISEIDVALGRLRGFACTEEGCEEKWETCDNWRMERAREVLDKLRELGLPDPSAELEKVVGRPVTADDLCAFLGTYRLYKRCADPERASEGVCREEYRRALEEARERLENAPGLKKRLAGLLGKLGSAVDRFKLDHDFIDGSMYLVLLLDNCGDLWFWHRLSGKNFEVTYYPPYEGPLARELKAWLTEYIDEMLRGFGLNKYETITLSYRNGIATRYSGLDHGTWFDLLETFAGLAPALNDVCVALPMRRVAGKTKERVRV